MDQMTETWTRRRIEPSSAIMLLVTAIAVVGAVWLHYRNYPAEETLTVGARIPALQFLDLGTSEPLVVLGHSGRVIWITFWSAESASALPSLKDLERVTKKLAGHRRFVQVVAAVEDGKASQVRAIIDSNGIKLPVYLATAAIFRRFGASSADPPLHVLIGADSRIIALARGGDDSTIARLAAMVQRRLDELDPQGTTRFAAAQIATLW